MKRLVVVCLMLMLAACGGAASQNAGTPIATVEAGGLAVSSFKGTVSGALTGDFSGTGTPFKQSEGGLLISLIGTNGMEIDIILPAGTVAGTYTPKSYADAYDTVANKITGIGVSFSVLNKTSGVDSYAIISDGTLTLQSLDPMTGSVHFKATLDGGGTVEVQATFYQLVPA